MRENNHSQNGRTLLETILVIVVMALISISIYKLFHTAVDESMVQKLEQDIEIRVAQLRHQAMTSTGIQVEANSQIMKASGYPLRTCVVDRDNAKTFTLCVGSEEEPFESEICEQLVERVTFSPINEETACHEHQTSSEFVFPMFSDMKNFESGEYNPTRIETVLDCGENAYQSGDHCVCAPGFGNYREGVGCSSGNNHCGRHAHQNGNDCECDSGYEDWTSGYGCYPICDDHGYLDSDMAACKCMEGYAGNGKVCTECGDRQYADVGGLASCKTCGAGKTHNSVHTGCENCPSSTTLGSCGCDSDKAPDGNGGCVVPQDNDCPPGQKSSGGSCIPCELGDETCECSGTAPYANGQGGCLCDHVLECDVDGARGCESGWCTVYDDSKYMAWCEKKPDHSYCIYEDYEEIPFWPDGWFGCEGGYFKREKVCSPCPDGYYSNGGDRCYECTVDHMVSNDERTQCVCEAGYYRENNYYRCTACPAGTYSAKGSVSNSACKTCGDRLYTEVGGKGSCQVCPAGQTHNTDHTGCINCDKGDKSCGCLESTPYADGLGSCMANLVCPNNSSAVVVEGNKIPGSFCYCNQGYIVNGEECAPICSSNADCGGINSGYYCNMDGTIAACFPLGEYKTNTTALNKTLKIGNKKMSYKSAENWCSAQTINGHTGTLISLRDNPFECFRSGTGTPAGPGYSCCAQNQTCQVIEGGWGKTKFDKLSPKMKDLLSTIGGFTGFIHDNYEDFLITKDASGSYDGYYLIISVNIASFQNATVGRPLCE